MTTTALVPAKATLTLASALDERKVPIAIGAGVAGVATYWLFRSPWISLVAVAAGGYLGYRSKDIPAPFAG
jgi:hypothetical protein